MIRYIHLMKTISTLAFLLTFSCSAFSQANTVKYNKALADSLSADANGMKQYVLVLLKTGTTQDLSKQTSDSLFKLHLSNMDEMVAKGKLVIAGPFKKNEKAYRGIFILNVKTLEEADVLLSTDAAIKAKLLEAESFYWYGSAALPMYLRYHNEIEKPR